MMRNPCFAAVAAAVLLVACGGGGGGGDSSPTPSVPSTASVALSGFAAKGRMANADVAVYAVNADGSVGSSAISSGSTAADGAYTLNFTATPGQPYVLRVTANAATTHLDEVTAAAQPLPAGFVMRALLLPSGTGAVSTSASVTPFSELMVAAASRAAGGINTANAQQAMSTVRQLLGFDPMAVTPRTTGTAAAGDEQRLAVLLTAVSKLAGSGGLGCSTGSAGDKTKCVVDALAAAAKVDSLKLASGAVDVSAVLAGAVTEVLATPALAGSVNPTSMATVMANLGCSANCSAGTGGGAGGTATAIAGARLLFTQIRSDWQAMFSRGGASLGGGAANGQALAFKQAMDGVQVPVDVLGKDLGAMLMGIDLYNDYLAGRDTVPSRGRAYDSLVANDGSGNFATTPATGCTLYTDTTNTVTATKPSEVQSIGCAARYFVSRTYPAAGTSVTTEWRHGFTIVANADGSFDYSTRARRRDQTCNAAGCTITANLALQLDAGGSAIPAFTGKVTPTLSAPLGSITAFTAVGELPAAFKSNGRALVNLKHTINLQGSQTAGASAVSNLSGTLVAYRASGGVEGTLTVKTGALKQAPVLSGGSEASEADLDLVWNTGTAEFEGRLALTDSVQDLSKSLRAPTKMLLSGALRNIAGGATTEFLSGSLGAVVTGLAAYDDTKPLTAANTHTVNLSFSGAVTAPGRPLLEFSIGTTQSAFDAQSGSASPLLTLQYRSLVGGMPKLVVAMTAQSDANGENTQFRLSEATANISMSWTGSNVATVDLMHAGTAKIGSLNVGSGLLTFSDGSFISLDIGL